MQFDERAEEHIKFMGYRPGPSSKIWKFGKDDVLYGVDFEKQEIFKFVDGERVYEDPEDETLNNTIKVVERACAPATTDTTDQSESEDESTTAEVVQHEIVAAPTAPVSRVTEFGIEYTPAQIDTIRNTVAKGADQNELSMFIHLCSTYGLDPFLKEIFYSPQMKTIMTSRDGYLKIAQRDPSFRGIQSMAVRENDDFELDVVNHAVKHKFGKGDRGKVIGAWAMVYKEGRVPVVAYADYSEYNKGNAIWNTYKSAMICKVAEAFALKRQFGISGLVTTEEVA